MRLKQKIPAAVIAVLLAATWAVPAMASRLVPPPTSTVGAHDVAKLEAVGGSVVTFQAPRGWSTTPSSETNSVTYTKPQNDQELSLYVVGGSKNFDITADRILRENSVSGTSAAFDGDKVSSEPYPPSGAESLSAARI